LEVEEPSQEAEERSRSRSAAETLVLEVLLKLPVVLLLIRAQAAKYQSLEDNPLRLPEAPPPSPEGSDQPQEAL